MNAITHKEQIAITLSDKTGQLKPENSSTCREQNDPSEIYHLYYPRIYNYVRCRVNDRHAVDDLVSRIFEKAFSAINSYDPQKAAFSTWIFTIARNTVIDFYRSESRAGFTTLDDALHLADQAQSPEERYFKNETRSELLKALARLSQREREIIALKFWSGCGNNEIAGLLEISESNVGVILYRAMRKLKNILGDNHFDYSR